MSATNVTAANKLQVDLIQPGLRARSEAAMPVNARFQWDGTAILEGRLDVELHDGNRILGHYRSGDVALTTGEQNFHMLLPPCEAPFSDSQVQVSMKFITTAGDVLELDPSSLFIPPVSQRSLVMAWCNARTVAAAPDFEQTMMLEHFAPQQNETGQRLLLTTLVRLAPEDLPAQPLSYTAFDTTVLTADAFSETTEGQLKSLARWVKGGGSVCVFVGGGLQAHHLWFLNELADSVSSGPTFLSDNNGHLVPGQKKISCLYSGMGRSVIITGTVGTEIPLDSPDWRRAVAFLWKFREARAQAIAETAHWEQSVTNQSGETAPITIEQYAAQSQSSRRPNWSVTTLGTNAMGAGYTAAARQAAETRLLQSLSAGVTLTDAQKDKIKGAMSNYLDAVMQFRTSPLPQRRGKMLAARQALDTNLMGILTPDQYATYQAMRRPPGGNFMDIDLVAQDLGLTADEKSKVKLAMDEWNATLRQALASGTSQRQSISLSAWQTFNVKLKQIVTPEQYAKFQAGYPNRYMTRRAVMQPIMPAQPFNYGLSTTPSYAAQPSMLAGQLMPLLLPKSIRLIPFSALLGILGLFLLAIGPGDYFLLGWLRRRRYTWMLFPALSICFMLATVLMANHFLGARDQRRSLFVIDLDKDGSALRWNRYDVIFAAADKQVVTELKDALWVPLNSGPMSITGYPPNGVVMGYSASGMSGPQYINGTAQAGWTSYNPVSYDETETGPALYEGIVPTHFQTSQLIRQWQPRLNRVFSFEPPPVPLLPDWSEVEAAWPDLPTVRAKLSAKKRFEGDVCAISTSLYSLPYQAKTTFDSESSQVLPPSIISEMCLGGSYGLRSVVSQISPNGGGSSEDVPAMDTDTGDSALVIVTQSGDDIIVYRRFFHGS